VIFLGLCLENVIMAEGVRTALSPRWGWSGSDCSHGSRRGLHSNAALRLGSSFHRVAGAFTNSGLRPGSSLAFASCGDE